jgi:hypothetical protein
MTDAIRKDKDAVLAEMRRRGGRVADQAEWREVFTLGGYTGDSDAAGFFGGTHPSMRQNPDGSRELTEHGWARS